MKNIGIVLKKKQDGRAWTGFILLRIRSSGGYFCTP
jgi:hypothetical protein